MVKHNHVVLPTLLLSFRKRMDEPFKFNFIHSFYKKRYELPKQVAAHSDVLFKAHEHSVIYNNTNIRLDDLSCSAHNDLDIVYSKTTYFDSMLTNRAMDYPFKESRIIREVYEPGPFLSSLRESKMSNHLGFNGFVELKDKSIIFVYRSSKVSIAKATWSSSVAASLKAAFALNDEQQLTHVGLSEAIRCEIKNELKLDVPHDVDLSQSIFAFYRDLVEGGKPQFLFYTKLDSIENHKDFLNHFKKATSTKASKKANEKTQIIDGVKFQFFTLDQLKSFSYSLDHMKTPDGKIYKMTPSMITSIVLLLKATS